MPAPTPSKTAAILAIATFSLNGCASYYSHSEGAIAGAFGGAAAGGAIGAICCGDPVHGIPAGMIIGAAAGGVGGFLWPTQKDGRNADQPAQATTTQPPQASTPQPPQTTAAPNGTPPEAARPIQYRRY